MVITRQIVAIYSAKRTFRMFIAEALWQTDIFSHPAPGCKCLFVAIFTVETIQS